MRYNKRAPKWLSSKSWQRNKQLTHYTTLGLKAFHYSFIVWSGSAPPRHNHDSHRHISTESESNEHPALYYHARLKLLYPLLLGWKIKAPPDPVFSDNPMVFLAWMEDVSVYNFTQPLEVFCENSYRNFNRNWMWRMSLRTWKQLVDVIRGCPGGSSRPKLTQTWLTRWRGGGEEAGSCKDHRCYLLQNTNESF